MLGEKGLLFNISNIISVTLGMLVQILLVHITVLPKQLIS